MLDPLTSGQRHAYGDDSRLGLLRTDYILTTNSASLVRTSQSSLSISAALGSPTAMDLHKLATIPPKGSQVHNCLQALFVVFVDCNALVLDVSGLVAIVCTHCCAAKVGASCCFSSRKAHLSLARCVGSLSLTYQGLFNNSLRSSCGNHYGAAKGCVTRMHTSQEPPNKAGHPLGVRLSTTCQSLFSAHSKPVSDHV